MDNVFSAFADKVRLTLGTKGAVPLIAGEMTIERDQQGRICALTFEELSEEAPQKEPVHSSAAATEAHLRKSAPENYAGQPSPGAAVAAEDAFDKAIERDAASGALDKLAAQSEAEHAAGLSTEITESLSDAAALAKQTAGSGPEGEGTG